MNVGEFRRGEKKVRERMVEICKMLTFFERLLQLSPLSDGLFDMLTNVMAVCACVCVRARVRAITQGKWLSTITGRKDFKKLSKNNKKDLDLTTDFLFTLD